MTRSLSASTFASVRDHLRGRPAPGGHTTSGIIRRSLLTPLTGLQAASPVAQLGRRTPTQDSTTQFGEIHRGASSPVLPGPATGPARPATGPASRPTAGPVTRPTAGPLAGRSAVHAVAAAGGAAAVRQETTNLQLRQLIAPATSFRPATTALLRRSPAAPPVGTPRGRNAPPIPVTGTVGPLPGAMAPADLAAFGAAAIGTTQLSQRFAAAAGAAAGTRRPATGSPSSDHSTIRRAFDLPSPSELFERARSWFAGSPDQTIVDTGNNGGTPSADQSASAVAEDAHNPPTTHSTELVGRRNSMSALLRQGSSMTDVDANQYDQPVADALSPREWDQLVDLVVERIEDRVRDELARRGRRFSPGVF